MRAIEQALAMILDRHPEGVLLVHGAYPRGADAIAAAYAARTPAIWSRSIPPTDSGTGERPVTAATPR